MIKLTSPDPKDEGNEQAKKENSSQNSLPDDGDDSLVDFKSPESKKLRSTRLPRITRSTAKPKMKIESNLKVRVNNQREKRKKETSKNKKSISKSHPTIESSFFKTKTTKAEENALDDVKAGVVCPLCFKVYKDEESQALHIKICAIKYKLSTKQVMDVMELQKRQEEERRSLGLLTGPALQERKKQTPRRTIQPQNEDADLQLGLALSRSLQEIEEINQFDDLDLHKETIELANWNDKEPKIVPQLEKFGFASTAKATITTKTRKRKLNEVTVLQTRSEADRNRILTERIAEILMGSDAITQDLEQSTVKEALKEQAMLRSSLLKTLHCTKTHLWHASTLLSEQVQFYVNELSDYIIPCEKCSVNNSDVQEIEMGSSNSIQQSEDLKSTEKGETFGDQKRFYEMSTTTECVSTDEAIEEGMNKFGNSLALDWEKALNDSSASDMIINVNNGKRIWAHKLVLYIRCPNILLDVMINDDSNISSIKEKIDWLDTHYDIALAFLEFIYCGRINKHKHVMDDNGLSKLRNMAWKYRVQELFEYLRKSEACKKDMNLRTDDYNAKEYARNIANAPKSPEVNTSNEISKNESPMQSTTMHDSAPAFSLMLPETDLEITLPQTQKEISLSQNENSEESVQVRNIRGTPCNNSLHEEITFGNIGMSPDMFDDTDEATSISLRNCTRNEPMEEVKVSDRSETTLTLQASSSILINSTLKIPSDSPERINDTEARISLLNTPNSSHPNRSKQDRLSLKKQRSNLSLFIEKFQKANNKSDSDTESDASIIHNIEVRGNRNPFNVRPINNSSIYSNLQQDDLVAQSAATKKIGLDALEYNPSDTDTEPYVHDSPSSFKSNVAAEEVSSDDEILAQLEFDLNLCTQKYSEKQNNVDDKCEAEQDTRKALEVSSPVNVADENVDLSQCETDEEEISMYAKYKKTHLHNSIADYRAILRKKIDSTIDSSENNSATGLSVTKNHSVIKEIEKAALSDSETECSHVSLLSSERDTPNRLKRKRLSRKRSDHSEKKHQDADSGSETDIFFADSPAQGETHNSRENPEDHCTNDHAELIVDNHDILNHRASPLCMPESEKSIWEGQAELVNEACSPQVNGMINETIRGGLLSPANLTTNKLQSPIWILSSPETSLKELDNKTDTNDKAKSNQSDDDMDHIFNHEIYLANVRIDDDVISEPPSPLNKSKSDGLIRYSSTNLHSSLESMLSNNGKTEIGLNSSVSRGKDALASERLSVRKLQRKSASHGNFTVNAKTNSMPNLNCSKCYRERLSGVSLKGARTEHSTTPPPDYQSMDTPKLHKELKKFGLKLQKRKRAVKLLTHIYNELHPVLPAGEGNIELMERISHNTSDRSIEENLSQDYSIADMPESDIIIAEERELDEIETITSEIGSNVKERFLKLIKTDRELYNKVLSYEPLCLETLHTLLKADGLKCNKNTLMDFLDEECITFYVQDNNRRDKARGTCNENKRKKASKKI